MVIRSILGLTPVVRRRDGAIRFVICYRRDEHTMPCPKMRLLALNKDGNKHVLEILGSGYQWVAEGPHAKGEMHYWENEEVVHSMWEDIPRITPQAMVRRIARRDISSPVAFERVRALCG